MTYKAIIGSRNYPNLEFVREYIKENLTTEDVIITGGARGVDEIAEQTAKELNIAVIIHYPDWSLGKGAGLIRNNLIIQNADEVIAFWDGKSRGTLDGLKKAKKAEKPYEIYGPNGEKLR